MNSLDKFNLKNKLSVVTGGCGLLGAKHVEALIEAGSDVIVIDTNESKFVNQNRDLMKRYQRDVMHYKCDISKEKSVVSVISKIYKKYKKYPDILINNAAIDAKFEKTSKNKNSRLEDFNIKRWDNEISVGLTGTMICIKHFGSKMAKKNQGVIVNISSHYGLVAPNQAIYTKNNKQNETQDVKPITYSAIKHAMIGLTRYTATYWAKNGVRCNALAPGGVFNNHDDIFVNNFSSLVPLGRMATKDEYKSSIIFLCSDASSYMNGSVLTVDGGLTCW